jgi:hypothetical protein
MSVLIINKEAVNVNCVVGPCWILTLWSHFDGNYHFVWNVFTSCSFQKQGCVSIPMPVDFCAPISQWSLLHFSFLLRILHLPLDITFMCRLSRNSGASASWNPKGLSRPVAGKLYLYLWHNRCSFETLVSAHFVMFVLWCVFLKALTWHLVTWYAVQKLQFMTYWKVLNWRHVTHCVAT